MNPPWGLSPYSTALGFGLDVAAKATVILAIVLLIQSALRRRRALFASAAGNSGLLALLLLLLSPAIVPSMPIACLPAETRAPEPKTEAALILQSALGQPGDSGGDTLLVGPVRGNPVAAWAAEVKVVRGSEAGRHTTLPPVASSGAPRAGRAQSRNTDWAALAIAVYAIVALSLLVRIGTSLWAVARLRRSCVQVLDTAWTEALARWRARLGIGRTVGLAWSPRVSVPVVLGWLRPTILVPRALMDSDTDEHADAVILHELAHVRRGDYAWNVLLRIVQALYWPHILVWLLGRAITEVRERACDDLCVHEIGGPSAYRETLLAVASGMIRRPSPVLGLAMARCSRLSRRLARIERSHGSDRCALPWPTRLAIALLGIASASIIGTIELTRAEARATRLDDPAQTLKAADKAPPTGDATHVFHLQVVKAETEEPVPGADVRVSLNFRDDWRKADAQGRLDITYPSGPLYGNFGVDVWGKGRAMQRHGWGEAPDKPMPGGDTIKLQPGETLGGLVQDESARPIAAATVLLWSHNYKKRDAHELLYDLRAVTGPDGRWETSGAPETTGELLGFKVMHPDFLSSRDYWQKDIIPTIANLRASKAVTVMKKGVPIEGRVVDADGKPVAGARVLSTDKTFVMFAELDPFAVSTDLEGRFRTGQVKPGQWSLVATARGHAHGKGTVSIGTAVPQVPITLGRPRPFTGRVVDPDGNPIAGAFVDPDVSHSYRCLGALIWTDADGRFRWDDAPGDELIVNVNQRGYRGVFQQIVPPSSEESVFTLRPSLRVRGMVRDAQTKMRIEHATVDYAAIDPNTGQPTTWTGMPELGFSTGLDRGNLDINFPVTADVYKFRIRTPGFRTFVSRPLRREEKVVVDYDITLSPGADEPAGAVATVLSPDGRPLAGARLFEIQFLGGLNFPGGEANVPGGSKYREDRTSPAGTFAIPQYDEPWCVFILGSDCYAFAGQDALEKSQTIQASPFARIEGQYHVGSRLVPNQELELSGGISYSGGASSVSFAQRATTDSDGRFAFTNVVPTSDLRIAPVEGIGLDRRSRRIGEPVRVEPGKTAQVSLGGKGRPVIGRVEAPLGWTQPMDFNDRSAAHIERNRPWIPYPLSLFRGTTMADWRDVADWRRRWNESPEAQDYADSRVAINAALAPDGSFRIDDVSPGDYRLSVRVNEEFMTHVALMRAPELGKFAQIVRIFTVPPIPGGRSDEALDLGVLRLQERVALKAGEPAPAFEVTTVDSRKLAVPGDYQGKFLLIDFATLWDIEAPTQIARLNEIHQKFGKDPRFAMLSLTSGADNAGTRASIAEKGEPWPQAIVGPLSNPIASAYGIDDRNVSTTILIGPDGRIAAKDLWREKIAPAIAERLGRAGQ
jgi:beta-lactamase regulating signal transducer with metallopeptidase domain